MLLSLSIKNIALIDEIAVDFREGFHVLTGETGAGKSIIVDALNLIIGNRADRGLIRTGCERASVEASVCIGKLPELKQALREELGIEEDIVTLSRIITANGRNICKINGETVTLQLVQTLMRSLIDLHGQHSYQILLEVENHRQILDDFGDEAHAALLAAAEQAYQEWHQSSLQLKKLIAGKKEREMQWDYVSKQLAELDELQLQEGEEEALSLKMQQIDKAAKIRDNLKLAYYHLYGFANEDSVLQKLRESYEGMAEIAAAGKDFEEIYQRLKNIYYDLEDITLVIRSLREGNEYSDKEENDIAERLDSIKKAKRKFGSFEDIVRKHRQFQEKMDLYVSLDDRIKEREKRYKESLSSYRDAAAALSASRKQLARRFEELLIEQLRELGMENIHFQVMFDVTDAKMVPTQYGNDRVEFYLSPNLGEPLKPLSVTASGGELSRIMLALKTIEADKNKIPCMIFDEVDSGISGKAAQVVAEKIAIISRYRQVLAVSHLAQIACMADVHYFVEKDVVGDRTLTKIYGLSGAGREAEIARLLGTVKENENTGLIHARSMLDGAKKFKEGLLGKQ